MWTNLSPTSVRGALAALVALGAAGCSGGSGDGTMVVVEVLTNLRVTAQIDTIAIRVPASELDFDFPLPLASGQQVVRAALVPRADREGLFEVEAVGLLGGATVLTQTARIQFTPGQAQRLTLSLDQACLPDRGCGPDDTCQAGTCIARSDAGTRGVWMTMAPDAGAGPDGAGALPDAAPPDRPPSDRPPPDTAPPPPEYQALLIRDTSRQAPAAACGATDAPGADIDAVELLEQGKVVGVGLKGSRQFVAPTPLCTPASCQDGRCQYATPEGAARAEGPPDARVLGPTVTDVGYFALNGGDLQLQLGDPAGNAPARPLRPGATVRVNEVDLSYEQDGRAVPTCACPPERYELWALRTPGSMVGAVKLRPGPYHTANATACAGATDGCGTTTFTFP